MRIFSGVTITMLFCLVPMQARTGQQVAKTLYLLEDDKHEQWCAFREEAEWKAEVESLSALVVATANYVDGRISAVNVTHQDEAGDWIVYDHYSLDENGRILKLKRTINVLPGDRSEDQVFLIASGSAKKQSTAAQRLSTGEPLPNSNEWVPDLPIATRTQEIPFFPLIGSQNLEMWSKGKSCVSVPPR